MYRCLTGVPVRQPAVATRLDRERPLPREPHQRHWGCDVRAGLESPDSAGAGRASGRSDSGWSWHWVERHGRGGSQAGECDAGNSQMWQSWGNRAGSSMLEKKNNGKCWTLRIYVGCGKLWKRLASTDCKVLWSSHLAQAGALAGPKTKVKKTGLCLAEVQLHLFLQTADVAVGPLTITRERASVVDFTQTIAEIHLTLLTSKPQESSSWSSTSPSIPPEVELQPRSGFQYGVVRGSEIEDILQKSDDDVSKRLWSTITENYNAVTVENIFEGEEPSGLLP